MPYLGIHEGNILGKFREHAYSSICTIIKHVVSNEDLF